MNPLRRFFSFFRRSKLDREMEEEMRSHLERETEQNLARGLAPDEARCAARRAFGGLDQLQERERDARGGRWLEDGLRDVRFAVRQLAKNPGFTAVAVLTLALGIGANTAIFSVVNSALLQPLPYPHPEQIVDVMETLPDGRRNGSISGGAFKDWRENSSKFAHLAVYQSVCLNLTGMGAPERVTGLLATGEFLSTLGVAPMIGRDFSDRETTAGGDSHVIVLTHQFWQSHYGGDPRALGSKVLLDQMPFTVIGVLPPRALLDNDVQFIAPEVIDGPGTYWGRDAHWRQAIGRLSPGITAAATQTELRGIKQRLTAQYPSWKEKWSVAVTPLQEILVERPRPMFLLLLGAVALVLLIACANISHLLLARDGARSREFAVRMALGASSWRLVRQMLIESTVLALAGCVLGLLFAWAGMRLLAPLVVAQLPAALQPRLDLPVLGFSLLLAGGCGVLFGLLPAWRAPRTNVSSALKESERASASRARRRSQSFLVVTEFALTLVLLIGAGLLLRSFIRLLEVDPGFNPRHTLAFDLAFPRAKYPRPEDRLRFTHDLIERVRALPGVESAAATSSLPLGGSERGEGLGRPDRPNPAEPYAVGVTLAGSDYFPTLGIVLVRGRVITAADDVPTAPPVLVIDTRVARELFPDEDPIGRQVKILGKSCEIVGIAAPVRHLDIEHEPRPSVYGTLAHITNYDSGTSMLVRSALPPSTLVATIRQAILEADPDQPIANVRTLTQAVDQSLAPRRTTLELLGLFATVAIGLACIGIYGVMSYLTAQRTRELSIRSVLGAQRRDIVRLVLTGGLKPALLGIGVGLAAALGLARLIESQLFEVRAWDPWVYLLAVVLSGMVALLSAWLPAWRAARVDPMVALRAE
jgi:predicted permease